MSDPKLIDALNRASSLELFQLSTLIQRHARRPAPHHRRTRTHAPGANGALPRLAPRADAQRQGRRDEGRAGRRCTRTRHAARVEAAVRGDRAASAHASAAAAASRNRRACAPPSRNDFRCGEKVVLRGPATCRPRWAPSCASTSAPPPSTPVTAQLARRLRAAAARARHLKGLRRSVRQNAARAARCPASLRRPHMLAAPVALTL